MSLFTNTKFVALIVEFCVKNCSLLQQNVSYHNEICTQCGFQKVLTVIWLQYQNHTRQDIGSELKRCAFWHLQCSQFLLNVISIIYQSSSLMVCSCHCTSWSSYKRKQNVHAWIWLILKLNTVTIVAWQWFPNIIVRCFCCKLTVDTFVLYQNKNHEKAFDMQQVLFVVHQLFLVSF